MAHILFAASEVFPHIKTGGLADVAGALPPALQALGLDISIVIPAYRRIAEMRSVPPPVVAEFALPEHDAVAKIRASQLHGTDIPLYLVDIPGLFDRDGEPYTDADGNEWPDNPDRFAAFSRVVCAMALGELLPQFKPDAVHCHDWHTGLVPALLADKPQRPATLFSIHNLAYQGVYDRDTFTRLELPERLWHPELLEYYGQFSFLKGGLACADTLLTVSPTYAEEITRPEFGFGLDGLLNWRVNVLHGILNGVDYQLWDPRLDVHIPQHYWLETLSEKVHNKLALQAELGLEVDASAFIVTHVGRLTWQKGSDLIMEALPALLEIPGVQCAFLGSGDPAFAANLKALADAQPSRCAATIGYNEPLAHRLIAGADVFLMPSRFEPCGLTQLYSLRYGTLPIVNPTGGLADTVTEGQTGYVIDEMSAAGLTDCVGRAVDDFRQRPIVWQQLARRGMVSDFSWARSAAEYAAYYQQAITARHQLR
ncbi:MAG: glycogen synthase GlgA [Gammaproteobacteria bacterium]|nr:glycogen synthase GlgA [Gammaproteobacteria bacterium]